MTLPANWIDGGPPFHGSNQNAVENLVNGLYASRGNTLSVFDYGAKVDGQRRQDGSVSSGGLVLNIVGFSGYHFTAADIGKTIIIGGGASSVANQAHVTTIAGLSGNNAILTTPAANAVSNVYVAWGTDDGEAWLNALTAAANMNNAQVAMPAGISICGYAISVAPTTHNVALFSLRGSGVATSQIICTASAGFLTLDLTGSFGAGHSAQIDFADLTIQTAIAGATTALSVFVTQGGEQYQRAYTAKNVLCTGFDNVSGYWLYPIQATGLYRPLLQDVYVWGPWPSTDYSDTSISYLTQVGINLSGSFSPSLSRVLVNSTFRAIQAISTVNNSPQGFYLSDCVLVGNREGFYFAGPGLPPQLTIRGGHYNNRDWNACINGWKFGIISHALSYMSSGWAPSSTLATAVNTGTNPTTLTLASTAGFAEAGAVLIGSEWFTYNNLTTGAPGSGMNGTTLNNVVRANLGTVDPGTNYAVGATVQASVSDILLIGTNTVRVDNELFEYQVEPHRFNVLALSGNTGISVVNSRHDAACIAVGIGNDSTGTELINNSHGTGTTQVLDGATDTIYKSKRTRSCRLVKTGAQSIATGTTPVSISWDSADWDTEGFWSSGTAITIPKNKGIKRVRITAHAVFAANATSSRMIEISVNGAHAESGNPFISQPAADSSFVTGIGAVCELSVNGGDTIAVQVAQDSGSALNVGSGTASNTFFICEVVEGA